MAIFITISGIYLRIIIVAAAYTSQTCAKCECRDADNRKKDDDWEKFKCIECGYETNADLNGAHNVALRRIKVA